MLVDGFLITVEVSIQHRLFIIVVVNVAIQEHEVVVFPYYRLRLLKKMASAIQCDFNYIVENIAKNSLNCAGNSFAAKPGWQANVNMSSK